tara:strand:+ start:13156 stop:13665 length:510 start_codon:yes stop_codon:yes gene_type:complete
MRKIAVFILLFVPFYMTSQNLISITPNQGMQGQTIPLIISGNNMNFYGFSNCPGLSQFRFFQAGGINVMDGTPTMASLNQLEGEVTIPAFQPVGPYTLEVLDGFSCQWIQLPFSFEVNTPVSTIYSDLNSTKGQPLRVTDILGKETKQTNQPLLYIYDDGTVEKRVVID